ncbi:MAG: biotin synthase, partial [Parachlamydiales bacterium]
PSIITTRTYEERLKTLDAVEKAGIGVCCGGIIGMGEAAEDRIGLLAVLANRNPQPASVPINMLIPVAGTPLEGKEPVSIWDMLRMVATARITMPKTMVRLSAGRLGCSTEAQALCFLAGANSIFSGEKLLTCPNPEFDEDAEMLRLLGLKVLPAFSVDR